ncbi:MAG: hypothetical protein JWL89_293 [Candidatus Saccharibacteria bacterium]|jgi:hypothetical protein|nr:hypothetical protein [Candidatus Saccharibacteria bacterium]
MSATNPESLDKIIEDAVSQAFEKLESEQSSVASYCLTKAIGATAFYGRPSMYRTDYRDDGSTKTEDFDPPLRRLQDVGIDSISALLEAGLRVKIQR